MEDAASFQPGRSGVNQRRTKILFFCGITCAPFFKKLAGPDRAWSLASDMDSASTVAGAVVAGRSAARLIRILRSR